MVFLFNRSGLGCDMPPRRAGHPDDGPGQLPVVTLHRAAATPKREDRGYLRLDPAKVYVERVDLDLAGLPQPQLVVEFDDDRGVETYLDGLLR